MDSNIKENFDVENKTLVIENLSKKVVKSYGRIYPNTADNRRKISWAWDYSASYWFHSALNKS